MMCVVELLETYSISSQAKTACDGGPDSVLRLYAKIARAL